MIPDRFVLLQDMPVSLSGKLDRRVIEDWLERLTGEDESIFSTGEQGETMECQNRPSTTTEITMQHVWATVLGQSDDRVPVNRSFQALGGDSIMAMQAIARGRNQGLNITMKDLLRGDDIKILSERSDNFVGSPPRGHSVSQGGNPMPLSAIQTAYSLLAQMEQPHHFNQSVQVLARRHLSMEELCAAMRAVVTRHASLRTRYDFTRPAHPTQRVSEDVERSFSVNHTYVNFGSSLVALLKEVQLLVDPISGPVIHCTLVEQPNGHQRLILVAPHLAVDIVSWKLILEDMEMALEGRDLGPVPSASYHDWCERSLVQPLPQLDLPNVVHDYWGYGKEHPTYADVARESFSLDSLTTEHCLKDSNACLRTKPTDLFIAAIAWAFRSTFRDRDFPVVCLEGHGRQRPSNNLDVFDTVGWFTTVMPVYVHTAIGEDLLQFCKRIKDARFHVESIGTDFFGGQDLAGSARVDIPEIMVNFTGASRADEGNGLLVEDPDSLGDLYDFSNNMRRFAVFEFSVSVDKGELEFELLYNRGMTRAEQVKEWLSNCRSTLQQISALLVTCPPQPTLSDHPGSFASYDELHGLGRDLQDVGVSMVRREAGPWAEAIFPATPIQNQMLRAQRDNYKYWHAALMLRVSTVDSSRVDLDKLAIAWKKVIAAHAILRTIFFPDPRPSSTDFINVVIQNLSLSGTVNIGTSADSIGIPRANWRSDTPEHRMTIVKHGETSVLCCLEISHALVDHASIPMILENLSLAYQNNSTPLHEVSYQEYASTITRTPTVERTDFWSDYLDGARPSIVASSSGQDVTRNKSIFSVQVNMDTVAETTRRILKAHGITEATVFRLAWALVLEEYMNSDEVLFGFMLSGRDGQLANIDRVIGPAINIGACRVTDFQRDTMTMLKDTQEGFFDVLDHQHSLAPYLSEKVKTDSIGLFDTIVNVRQHKARPKTSGFLLFEDWPGSEDPYEYAVVVEVDVHEELETTASLTCWSESMPREHAQRLGKLFQKCFAKIITDVSMMS